LREAAGRPRGAGKQNETGILVTLAARGEHLPPDVLGLRQRRGDELAEPVVGNADLAGCRRARLFELGSAAVQHFEAADQDARIDAERPGEDADDDQSADAKAAAPAHGE
jgi:hypothetical protein